MHVHRRRHSLKVARIHASAIAAKMINLEAVRNGADQLFVYVTMPKYMLALDPAFCVTIGTNRASPVPAAVVLGKVTRTYFLKGVVLRYRGHLGVPPHRGPVADHGCPASA